ncbi:Rv3235 family protein [Saccharopolyspora sp. NFXS83]|uniref:Rv3235 family protein n=1 Tax=Saccharopolyspora sp. NFXS83 TaxID=2993560 RepID=UPI00224B72E4|nr:Rv3235 family protein [Saccharopolyspora sp. NFXS83]MCX2733922.1 Rv3235 family protein [Saccharopolyspora sp. NFXS83]
MTAPTAPHPILLPAATDPYFVPDDRAVAPTSRTELANSSASPADRTSCALAGTLGAPVIDVLLGRRPLGQIKSRVSPSVHGLLKSGSVRRLLHEPQQRLLSMHACAISPDLVEGCAVIASRIRTRALVLRWERSGGGWSCTFLSVV